jgi:hypothetical protein
VAKLAFQPPPSSYTFAIHEGKETLMVQDVYGRTLPFTPPGELTVIKDIRTRRGNTICAFYIQQPEALFTLLFSHGNAVRLPPSPLSLIPSTA